MGNVDLDGIPLFARLTPQDRERAGTVARQLQWEVGHIALREGEFAFDFYAIKRGAVEVRRAGQTLAVLGAGDFFGEIGLARHRAGNASRRRSATVVVIAPTEAVAIPANDMRRLTEAIPALGDALDRAVAERSSV
jgi:CRP-like cAMP-binding protein